MYPQEQHDALTGAGFTANAEQSRYENGSNAIRLSETEGREGFIVGTLSEGDVTWKDDTYASVEEAIEACTAQA